MRPPKTALQGISLIIPKGECFGLLGVNGMPQSNAMVISEYILPWPIPLHVLINNLHEFDCHGKLPPTNC